MQKIVFLKRNKEFYSDDLNSLNNCQDCSQMKNEEMPRIINNNSCLENFQEIDENAKIREYIYSNKEKDLINKSYLIKNKDKTIFPNQPLSNREENFYSKYFIKLDL